MVAHARMLISRTLQNSSTTAQLATKSKSASTYASEERDQLSADFSSVSLLVANVAVVSSASV